MAPDLEQTTAGKERFSHHMVGLYLATAVIVVAVTAYLSFGLPDRRAGAAGEDEGLRVHLEVEPFETSTPQPPGWDSAEFARELASRLGRVQGLEATVGSLASRSAQFRLRGTVAVRQNRLMLGVGLTQTSTADTVWSMTYWRAPEEADLLMGDLTSAVADAVLGAAARLSITTSEERR